MSKKLGKLKTFELLDTLNWEFIKEYIVLNQSLEEKDEEIKPILDCIKKNHCIAELEKEIAELEKEKQTAVKEFAETLKMDCFKNGEFDDISCYRKNACELIDKLLKERGIE